MATVKKPSIRKVEPEVIIWTYESKKARHERAGYVATGETKPSPDGTLIAMRKGGAQDGGS